MTSIELVTLAGTLFYGQLPTEFAFTLRIGVTRRSSVCRQAAIALSIFSAVEAKRRT
jgi:hypothetical protein